MTLDELKQAEHLARCRFMAKDASKRLRGEGVSPACISWSGSDRSPAFLPADRVLVHMLADTFETYALKMAGELADLGVFTHEGVSPDGENGRKDENNDPGR